MLKTHTPRPGAFAGRISVVLAEDHMIVRQGLRALLEAEGDIDVLGEAENGRHAVQLVRQFRPDVAVMDIAMPLLNGLEATRQIREAVPGTKVLILSAHGDDAYIEHAIGLGASGYLIKQSSSQILTRAIREAHKGNLFFSPSVARRYLTHQGKPPLSGSPLKKKMSAREAEVLQLIAEGMANKEIASELGISVKTVEKHRQHLMQKLGIHDTAGLTRYAIAQGVIESSVQLTLI